MNQRVLILTFGACLSLITIMAFNNGPYPENTNAPGEMTCYRSGCHSNNGSGNGSTFISNISTGGSYQNLDTLQLRFGFSSTYNNEHGFQILALDTSGNNVGNWIVNNSSQYKVINGFSFPTRKYLEHTLSGSADSVWQINWVTPTSYQGRVKFYASFLASNNNNLNTGDTLYLNTLDLVNNQLTGIEKAREQIDFQLDYFATQGKLVLKNSNEKIMNIKVYNLRGSILYNFNMVNQEQVLNLKSGIHIITASSASSYQSGIYKVFIP